MACFQPRSRITATPSARCKLYSGAAAATGNAQPSSPPSTWASTSASNRSLVSRRGTPRAYTPTRSGNALQPWGVVMRINCTMTSPWHERLMVDTPPKFIMVLSRLAEQRRGQPGGLSLIPLERFTEEAREALARVQQLLLRLRHNQLDAEHLLLALLGEPDGLVKAAFQKLDGFQPALLLEWLRAELGRRPVAAQTRPHLHHRARQAGARPGSGRRAAARRPVRRHRAPAARAARRSARRADPGCRTRRSEPRRAGPGLRRSTRRSHRRQPDRRGLVPGAREIRRRPDRSGRRQASSIRSSAARTRSCA